MTAASYSNAPKSYQAIVLAGLIAGTLDITYAFVYFGSRFGVGPARILRSVASGLLGKSAATGGLKVAALGAVLHYFIAFSAAAVYYLASRKLAVLATQPFICGPIYGAGFYFFMNFVVLPLSAFPGKIPSGTAHIPGLLVHMFLIGLSIALVTQKYSKN